MRDRHRAPISLLLALSLALPPLALAQEPAPPPAAPTEAASPAGAWEGWAKLTNDWPDLQCRYEGSPDAASVHLELTEDAGQLKGSVAIDLPAQEGSGCPPLRKRYAIGDVTSAAGALSFVDSGGNEWTLSVRRRGSVLQGLLAWRAGGPDQPLAEGFALRDGKRPLSRLSGELRLHRAGQATEQEAGAPEVGAAAPAAGAATPAKPPAKTSAGKHLRNIGIVLGANVVGLGLLYGVNKLGKGSNTGGGVLTCSPRWCIVGVPPNPCGCQGPVLSGAPCGTPSTGVTEGNACDTQSGASPCQSGLSCNNNVCEGPSGRCPF